MPLDDRSANDIHDPVLYALFLSIVPGAVLTPAVIEQHAAHLEELDREGRLILAGPMLMRFGGLIILRVASLAEAQAVADEDPMIRGSFQTYELATWLMANKANRYQPSAQPARTP
jgi:uncharacterized protein